jgi:predicted ArsR family transcriptional regulator
MLTPEQLADLTRPPEQEAIAALQRGDRLALDQALARMAQGNAGLDALSVHTLARKAGKLRQDLGEDAARAALRRIGAQLMSTWIAQIRAGDLRGAVADLVAVFKHQGGVAMATPTETDDALWVEPAPCGSGGRIDRQQLARRHPAAYGGWSDGVNSLCQACQANQAALNDALGAPVWTSTKGADGACRLRFDKGAQRGQPLFSEAEREALPLTRLQRIHRRLDQGDTDTDSDTDSDIASLLDGQRKDWMPWHDFGIVWLEYFYATALEHGGTDYLDETLAQTYEPAFVAGFAHYGAMSDEELVRSSALTWHYHCADFSVHEEADRFVFKLDPCGSGGRLLRGQVWRGMFHYGEPLSAKMAEPHTINFLRRDAPTYCTHCAASNRAQLTRLADPAVPLFFVIDGHAQMQPGQPCHMFSYRKGAARERIDPALLQQIGLAPPTTAGDCR